MSDKTIERIQSALLAFAIGIFGALALSHWAACEQDDSICAIGGPND